MERYTYFEDGKWRILIDDTEHSGPWVDRLAAYEDTGLEPEEIKTVIERYLGFRSAISDETGQPMVSWTRASELVRADKEGRVVVLDTPCKPLVWGDDDRDTALCPDCGKDLMGLYDGERIVLQCPACGQYLDDTKIITRAEAKAAVGVGKLENQSRTRSAVYTWHRNPLSLCRRFPGQRGVPLSHTPRPHT